MSKGLTQILTLTLTTMSKASQLALRGLRSAPGHASPDLARSRLASGCQITSRAASSGQLRPASANQPVGPHWHPDHIGLLSDIRYSGGLGERCLSVYPARMSTGHLDERPRGCGGEAKGATLVNVDAPLIESLSLGCVRPLSRRARPPPQLSEMQSLYCEWITLLCSTYSHKMY